MRSRVLRVTSTACFMGLVLLFLFGLATGSQKHPAGMLTLLAAMYGGIALGICYAVARLSGRPVGPGDVVRIVCWVLLAAAEGVREVALTYYPVFWPQYALAATGCAFGIMGTALAAIILTMIVLPPLPRRLDGQCAQCGYQLKGLTRLRCPECGTPFEAVQAASESVHTGSQGPEGDREATGAERGHAESGHSTFG